MSRRTALSFSSRVLRTAAGGSRESSHSTGLPNTQTGMWGRKRAREAVRGRRCVTAACARGRPGEFLGHVTQMLDEAPEIPLPINAIGGSMAGAGGMLCCGSATKWSVIRSLFSASRPSVGRYLLSLIPVELN